MNNNRIYEMQREIIKIIDDLQGLIAQSGLANQGAEEEIITTLFLYKFLNDKFYYNLNRFSKEIDLDVQDIINNKDMLSAFYDFASDDVVFTKEDTIEHLTSYLSKDDFYKEFDKALENISNNPRNEKFSIREADGTVNPLFRGITHYISGTKKNNFAATAFGYISNTRLDFGELFEESFDFYETIFEYLIKQYNVASGVYAEYFTPQTVSKIIAAILVNIMGGKQVAEIYDPAAGSGSLILHLANELGSTSNRRNAYVYTQDISSKSNRFLRLNLILNGLSKDLERAIQGDTLLDPAHFTQEGDISSGLKKFDAIVSNPPFKMDFSTTRDQIESKWNNTDRFENGVPNIPEKDKAKMEIYLLFIQHIIYSLKDNGLAAVVVPTGFLTAKNGLASKVKKKLIKEKMIIGVLSMPSNIFANTPTSVSVIFFGKKQYNDEVLMVDASKLGTKKTIDKNQRTILTDEETNKIINTFINKEAIKDFSVLVSNEDIIEKGYMLSPGQHFPIEIKYVNISKIEFDEKIKGYSEEFKKLQLNSEETLKNIIKNLESISYEKR